MFMLILITYCCFKVVPIEGKTLFNGEKLKTFEEVLPEMAIAQLAP